MRPSGDRITVNGWGRILVNFFVTQIRSTAMRKMRFKREELRHHNDVVAIQNALGRMGYDVEAHDVERAYSEYSEDRYAAGWMSLEIVGEFNAAEKCLEFLEPVPELTDEELTAISTHTDDSV